MWPVPLCHAVFFGLAKGFVGLIFPSVGKKKGPQKEYAPNPAFFRAQMKLPEIMRLSKAARDFIEELSRNMVS